LEVGKEVTVGCPEGIHARPAACLVRVANEYAGKITIHYQNQMIDAKSIMSILAAGIGHGAKIKVVVAGDAAEPVLEKIGQLLETGANL